MANFKGVGEAVELICRNLIVVVDGKRSEGAEALEWLFTLRVYAYYMWTSRSSIHSQKPRFDLPSYRSSNS